MFKYIFALLVIAVAWIAAFVLKSKFTWVITAAIVVTIVTLLALGALVLYRRYKARKAAREIEKALNAQADEHARSVRPEQQAEVRAMQAEVQRAIASLKSSKLGSGGAEALYALPWYVIIGPPAAGKTTALKNSGLQFPYLSAQTGGGVRGVGGTRNCEWWLTNEAVLLDTAGRYTTEDDDREEWLAFLDLLKKNRPGKPLNGVLVAVAVSDLIGAREAQISAIAKRVRERVDEVMGRLQMVLPVYLLFTKSDLIQGFSEYFGDLRKTERGQVWGFTVPLGTTIASPGELFSERFDALASVIDSRKWRRVATEQHLDVREQVLQFPQQFASVRENLKSFVEDLFASNVYSGSPIMRGVYFTSGAQEGRPIDQLTARLRETFNLPAAPVAAQPQVEGKSFFLRDVFARVVFPDANVAAQSPEELRRQRRRRYFMAAGAFATALVIMALPAYAYVENRALLRESSDEIEAIARAGHGAPLTLSVLEPVRTRVEQLRGWSQSTLGPPPYMRFGMYAGDQVYPDVRRFYLDALKRHVVQRLDDNNASGLDRFATQFAASATPPPRDLRQTNYHALRTHLLLSNPREAGIPAVRDQKSYLTSELTKAWAASTNVPDGSPTQTQMQANMQAYVDLLGDASPTEFASLALRRRDATVGRARAVLTRDGNDNYDLGAIVNDPRLVAYNITLPRAIQRSPAPYMFQVGTAEDQTIPGAYTRDGWENVIRDRLRRATDDLVDEPWVVGRAVNVSRAAELAQALVRVRSRYFETYSDEWNSFLRSIRIRPPPITTFGRNENPVDRDATLGLLRWLEEGGLRPYEVLMRTVAYHIELLDPQEAVASATGSAGLANAQRTAVARLQGRGIAGQTAATALGAAMAQRGQGTNSLPAFTRESVANDPRLKGIVDFGVPPPPPPTPAAQPGQPTPVAPPTPNTTPLHAWHEQIALVRNAMINYFNNPTQPQSLEALRTAISTAQTRTEELITGATVEARPVLIELLRPPLQSSAGRAAAGGAGGSSDRWCSAVAVPFYRNLYNRYPFARGGQDAALTDVAEFFRPQRGALWTFYTENLVQDIPREGEHFTYARRLGTDTARYYDDRLQPFLERSQDVSSVLFPPRSEGIQVDFDARVRGTPTIAEVNFEVDGEPLQYRNGPPEWHRFRWPGTGQAHGAKVRARGLDGLDEVIEQDGEWGLFRLLEAGEVRGSPEARVFSVEWRMRDRTGPNGEPLTVGLDIRPVSNNNPFMGIPRQGNSTTARFLLPFRAPGLDAPHPISNPGRSCDLSDVPDAPRSTTRSHRRHRRSRH